MQATNPPAVTMSDAVNGLSQLLNGKRTLAAARGISNGALNRLYRVARELHTHGRQTEALRTFELLCLYDHENPNYWQALGICRKALQDYLGAAAALTFATGLRPEFSHDLQTELIECLILAGQLDAARTRLAQLLDAADGHPQEETRQAGARCLQLQLARAESGGSQ